MISNQLNFRAIEDKDLTQLHQLLNNFDNQQQVGGKIKPMSLIEVSKWLEQKRNTANIHQFAIEKENNFCGYIQLADIDKHNENAALGINLLPEFSHQGIGVLAIRFIHKLAKEKLLLNKIYLSVRSDNTAAINLYLKNNYKQAGCLTKHIKTPDGFVDLNFMEILL